jgi:hypothetical protein
MIPAVAPVIWNGNEFLTIGNKLNTPAMKANKRENPKIPPKISKIVFIFLLNFVLPFFG